MKVLQSFALVAALLVLIIHSAAAQNPQFVPAFPLYCKGPMTTSVPINGRTTTHFIWAAKGAGMASPVAGQCVWADRTGRDLEVISGGNVVCDYSGAMRSVPAGTFVELGVARDPLAGNCMHVAQYIGTVSPPFSAVPSIPPFVRPSIKNMSVAQIASLQHGIAVMKGRPVTDPTSYAFQANIHGTGDSPTTPQESSSWNNCEHGSYYFLSWHRMYLYFFDRILRAASGDPKLVLPYWNWTDGTQRTLPAPFRQPANSSNSLYVAPPDRPAALDAGTANLGIGVVAFSAAFADTNFDTPAGSGASFGGQIVAPNQFNSPHGAFESQPHDVVHVALGGLMSDPDTAARDPIFWLHHANIDRMWNLWIAEGGGRSDPADAAWRNTRFTFFDEAGHAVYLTGAEVVDTVAQLNYRYDDEVPGPHGLLVNQGPVAVLTQRAVPVQAQAPRGLPPPLKLLAQTAATPGAAPIVLAGKMQQLDVPLPDNLASRLRTALASKPAPGELVLRLDDIQYQKSSGVYYEVYINPPSGQTLDPKTRGYLGNLALFGLKPHAMAGHAAPTSTIHVDFDIPATMADAVAFNPKMLSVVLVPHGLEDNAGVPLPFADQQQGTVGNVRVMSR